MNRKYVLIMLVIAVIVVSSVLSYYVMTVKKHYGAKKVSQLRYPRYTNESEVCASGGEFRVCLRYSIVRKGSATYVVFRDLVNRTLMVRVPVRRIVITFYPQLYLAVLGVKDFPKYVVGWRAASWKLFRYDYYEYFLKYMPQIAKIPDVGCLYRGTFNPEKVIELHPDVVFADKWQYQYYNVLKKVVDAGIPVVFLDHGKTLFGPVKSILIIGLLTGHLRKAEEIASWILRLLWLIFSRLAHAKKMNVKVFLERGYRLWYTQGRYGWGEFLYLLGARNIAEGKIPRIGTISPEYVISQNPQYYIITCSWWVKRPNTPLCGVNITNKTLIIERAIGFIKLHQGIESIQAIREGNVWLIYHDLDHNFNWFGILLLAKILYPDLFRDINATELINEFFEKFIGVPFRGTWILHIGKDILIRYGVLHVAPQGKLCASYMNYTYCVHYSLNLVNNKLYITVKDLAGNTVTAKYPAKRVVIVASPYIVDFIAVNGPGWSIKVVGWDPSHFKEYRRWIWEKYSEVAPDLNDIPNIGSLYKGSLDVEKIIALHPDIVIASVYQCESAKGVLARIEDSGIPVLCIDFHSETVENHVKSILLLGLVLGREDRAREIAEFYMSRVIPILLKLSKIMRKPKVFVEAGYRMWLTFGPSYMWGAIITKVGGIDIADSKVTRWGVLSPEYVISQNPDIWIITCAYWPNKPDSPWCGYYANASLVVERALKWIKLHKGMQYTNAFRNGVICIIHHGLARHIYDFVAFEFLAKILHPELFRDLDPLKDFEIFHEKFLPVNYSGTWFLCLNKTVLNSIK
ncbi:MAG: ABC transporter substrate-binding protein [Crenarchaeota archaeon]|nr:ABC transporter substrate-binding protein [Thermoproteota archaeon]